MVDGALRAQTRENVSNELLRVLLVSLLQDSLGLFVWVRDVIGPVLGIVLLLELLVS